MTVDRRTARSWAVVVAVTTISSVGFSLLGLPSAVLFGALLGGMVHGLGSRTTIRLPSAAFRTGQGLVGVTIGAMVSLPTLARMRTDLAPIVLVTLATLGLSIFAGWLLALRRDVTLVTGTFALIAGGASGIVALADELGADDRVVTVVQYLRVLAVLMAMPLVTAAVFAPEHGLGRLGDADPGWLPDLGYTLLALAAGLVVGRLLRFPTATLLGPLTVAVLLTAAGWFGEATVPVWLQWTAYVLIGVQVGLRFTRESIASIARMLPAVTLLVAGIITLCAGLGALLTLTTGVDGLTAYLATTPGGIFAVLATAADSGSDVTYVMAVQVFRLLVILLLTPFLASWLRRARRDRRPSAPSGGSATPG